MPVLLKDDKSVLFIHIPKCGGTSFEEVSRKIGWQETFSVRGIHGSKLQMFNCTPQHFHADLLQRTFDLSRFDCILAIVRHPFDRLKSEYYWQINQGVTSELPADWWSIVMNDYARNPYIHDNHIRPQHEFLVDSPRLEKFRLEDNGIADALAHLPGSSLLAGAKRYLLAKQVRKKRSTYEDNVEQQFEDLRTDIEAFYAKDIQSLGYAPRPAMT